MQLHTILSLLFKKSSLNSLKSPQLRSYPGIVLTLESVDIIIDFVAVFINIRASIHLVCCGAACVHGNDV